MKEEIIYLYLDDNDKITRDGDVEYLNAISNRVKIVTDYPCSWSQRTKQILADIENIDGLILDWELTNKSDQAKDGTETADDVDFSAESLAEHLRISVVKEDIKDIPIILCSADRNNAFTKLRSKELTGQDLFDLTFVKSDLFDKDANGSEAKLFDLAHAYKLMNESKLSIDKVLALSNEDLKNLDIRFIDKLEKISSFRTVHDFIQFILNQLILREGILINEDIVAARLGVDRSKSPRWPELLDVLKREDVVYNGILSGAWLNYWSFKLENWWRHVAGDIDLRTNGATIRVEILNEKFGLGLVVAEKLTFCSSDEFWTVCYGLKRALDPSNGFLIDDSLNDPWLEKQYVSALAELEKSNADGWRIDIMDRERFRSFKSLITRVNK